jgi:hypothetical protein
MSKTLFLIETPFQALCAFEAINQFEIKSYDFKILYFEAAALRNLENLMIKEGFTYTKEYAPHIILKILPRIFTAPKYYDRIFIGYYYCLTSFALASTDATFKAKIYYLDDGAQTLSIFTSKPPARFNTFRQKAVQYLFMIIYALKLTRKFSFFTIYQVRSKKYNIIQNNLTHLRRYIPSENEGIYILGTNPSVLEFKDYSYQELVHQLHKYLKLNYPLHPIYYCPHRRDVNNEAINTLCKELEMTIFDTEVSVEYDFPLKKINPKLIIGFNSNALFTLKMLFPNSRIESVNFTLKSNSHNESTQLIQNVFKQNGISTIDVFEASSVINY